MFMTAQNHYKLRDEQEKYFAMIKGVMGADRQRNWSELGKEGRLLIRHTKSQAMIEKNSRIVIEAFTACLITREEAIRELKARGADLGAWTMLQDTPPASTQLPVDNQQAG
jgi:hypothetical protein